MIGDWFTYVAVSQVVLSSGSGALGVAFILLAHTVPKVMAAPVAGWLADTFDPRVILAVMSCVRGGFVLGMLLCVMMQSLLGLQLFLVARMAIGAFVDTAASRAMPGLVSRSELSLANTIRSTSWSMVFGLAVAAGGFAMAFLGPVYALAIDAGSFFLAALLFSQVRIKPLAHVPSSHAGHWRTFLMTHPDVLFAALAKMPVAIANGAAWVVLHVVTESWAEAAISVGILHACRALGTGLGPVLWQRSAQLRLSRVGISYSIFAAFAGIGLFLTFEHPMFLAMASVLWGLGVGANWVSTSSRLQTLTPEPMLGRVTAVDIAAQTAGQCAGGIVCALLASHVGISVAGMLLLLLGVAMWCVILVCLPSPDKESRCATVY